MLFSLIKKRLFFKCLGVGHPFHYLKIDFGRFSDPPDKHTYFINIDPAG